MDALVRRHAPVLDHQDEIAVGLGRARLLDHQCTGKAGSVLFFDCNLMHGSSSNISPLPRRKVLVREAYSIYCCNSDAMKVLCRKVFQILPPGRPVTFLPNPTVTVRLRVCCS